MAEVRACGKTSVGCSPPLDTVMDAQGVVSVTVPGESQGFFGAFLITDPASDAGGASDPDAGKSVIIPTRVVQSLPFTPRVTHFVGAGVRSILEAYASTGGFVYDPTSAYAQVFPNDCQYSGAVGAVVEATDASDKTRVFYLSGGIPDLRADRTNLDGAWVGFLPAPATSEFIVHDGTGGRVVGSICTTASPDGVVLAVVYPLAKGSIEFPT